MTSDELRRVELVDLLQPVQCFGCALEVSLRRHPAVLLPDLAKFTQGGCREIIKEKKKKLIQKKVGFRK